MSILARSAAPLRHVALRAPRAAPVRSMHSEQAVPFNYSNKTAFGAKVFVYLATGFAVPFVAAYYQMSKSS
ncbi:uncharacterized protein BXZ73DRAFT_97099 [Epithele typhae]|uniref:uncharacterized protein n=1 Tax=Epithele typhae TaxID=378194 RepID=UPI00200873BF|nr:uncharacterized protein BXZ73DRAFT_97099 [Epithele typhae]KAH9943036.1 hypothetical protein BXZ73DRAFT_97099 [Epithele typhae]